MASPKPPPRPPIPPDPDPDPAIVQPSLSPSVNAPSLGDVAMVDPVFPAVSPQAPVFKFSSSVGSGQSGVPVVLPSPDLGLEKSVAPNPVQAQATGGVIFSFGGSSSAAGLLSSPPKSPLLPSPNIVLGNQATVPDSVPVDSIPSGKRTNSFGGYSSVAQPPSASWVATVKAPPPRVTFPTITDSGIPRVGIPTAIFKEGAARHREFVALTFLDKTPSMGKIHAFLSYLWGKNKKIEVFSNSLGTIVARVQSEELRQRIFAVKIWHIDGDAFIAQEWSHEYSYSKPNLEEIPIWVRFNKVPCDLVTEAGLFHIGGAIGHPIAVRNLQFSSGEVQVKTDLSKPLSDQVEVETDEGIIITLDVAYLKLPPICSHCRIIGHRDSSCKVEVKVNAPLVSDCREVSPTPQLINDNVSFPEIPIPLASLISPTENSTINEVVSAASSPSPAVTESVVTVITTSTESKSVTPELRHIPQVGSEFVSSASAAVPHNIASDLTTHQVSSPAKVLDSVMNPESHRIVNGTVPISVFTATTTISESLPTPSLSPKVTSTITATSSDVSITTAKQSTYASVVASPDGNSAPSSPLPKRVASDKAKAFDTCSFSSPASEKPLLRANDISYSTPKPGVKVVNTGSFGGLLDKNGVFIGDDWSDYGQTSRGGRRLKPSQKKQEMNRLQSRGRGRHGGGTRSKR